MSACSVDVPLGSLKSIDIQVILPEEQMITRAELAISLATQTGLHGCEGNSIDRY
jgi:hypothetical protein